MKESNARVISFFTPTSSDFFFISHDPMGSDVCFLRLWDARSGPMCIYGTRSQYGFTYNSHQCALSVIVFQSCIICFERPKSHLAVPWPVQPLVRLRSMLRAHARVSLLPRAGDDVARPAACVISDLCMKKSSVGMISFGTSPLGGGRTHGEKNCSCYEKGSYLLRRH